MINFGNISIADLRLGATQVKAAYIGDKQVWSNTPNWLRFDILADDTSIDIVDDSGTLETPDLEYSVDDGATWTSWVPGSDFPHEMAGAVVYVRAGATGNTGFADLNTPSAYWHFTSDDLFSVSGNIMSLLSRDGSTGLSEYCFYRLFNGCTMLVDAGGLELPATTLAQGCYEGMFRGCTSLSAAPELPATTLDLYCYKDMLSACTSLTTAPELPATTLAEGCYLQMFTGCTALTAAPVLPAETLSGFCYYRMFSGCSSLSSMEVAFTDWNPSNATQNWVSNVAATGTFKCPEELSDIRDASHIPTGWQVEKKLYIQDGLICWYDGIDNAGAGQHSSDTTTWKNLGSLGSTYDATRSAGTWQSNGAVFQEDNQSQRFDIKNALMSSQMQGEWTYEVVFTPTANWFNNYNGLLGNHEDNALAGICGGQYENGNVYFSAIGRGIANRKVVCWQASQSYLNQYVGTLNTVACAASTTSGTAKVWHNGDLKNTVNSSSFTLQYTADFFIGAAFPAYDRVFDGVIHCLRIYNRPLTESEHLHNRAVDLQRFGSAQNNWLCFTAEEANSTLHLDKVGSPDAISIETSTDGTTWTDYSWTDNTGDTLTLANVGDKVYMRAKTENQTIGSSSSNYYTFIMSGTIVASGNIQTLLKADGSRTDAPTSCFRNLFTGCTSLTTAPTLPATILADRCYQNMFNGCTSLTTAPSLPATTLASSCYTNMFNSCTSLTTAPAVLPAMTLANYCYSNMFQGCSSLTTAPVLPATTLASYCYSSMFKGCSSLTTATALPATTLASNCYNFMFQSCQSLNSVEVAFTTWTSGTTTNWLDGVAASGTLTCPAALPDTRGASNIPTGWTKVDAA